MAAGIYNFTIEQGATFTRTFKYKDANGDPLSLSDHAVRMQIRSSVGSTSTLADITESGTSKFQVSTENTNEFTLTLSATDTTAYAFDQAVYDIEIEKSGVVTRLLQGKIKLSKQVTR